MTNRDPQQFQAFLNVTENRSRILAMIVAMVHDFDIAEDLFQETVLEILRSEGQFDPTRSFTEARAPAPLQELAERTGAVQLREVIEVDVSPAIQEPGPITIVLTLNETIVHDIWFGSRESNVPPQLILTYLPP